MNVQLILAGSIALLGAAFHGVGGELAVVSRLSPQALPASRFGGPRTTMSMIHITWHMTTIAFFTLGVALLVSGSALNGDTARGIGVVCAAASTGYAALALGLGAAYAKSPRAMFRHPAPILLTAVAVLSWWGAL